MNLIIGRNNFFLMSFIPQMEKLFNFLWNLISQLVILMYSIKISTLSQKLDFDKSHGDLILQMANFENIYGNLISQILAKAAKPEKFVPVDYFSLSMLIPMNDLYSSCGWYGNINLHLIVLKLPVKGFISLKLLIFYVNLKRKNSVDLSQ